VLVHEDRLQGAIKLAELGPKSLIDEAPRRPDHDGAVAFDVVQMQPVQLSLAVMIVAARCR
jgi:hypothetical protein